MMELPSGTVTFLFTDIEGSTVRWEQHPAAMRVALARHDAVLHGGIAAHGGVVVTERGEGDSFFALFARPSDALAAVYALQQALVAEPWPQEVAPLRVRMALHTGEAGLWEGDDYRGAAVNRCARLRAVAHGGQILLSAATYELVRDHLPSAVALLDLGEHRLKDLTRPEHIFQVHGSGLPADFPPLKTLDRQRHNLPVQPTALIGRAREVREVRARLREPQTRLLTLTGPGGTGKTRLALQVGAEALEAFPDGVFFVNLAPLSDPELVVPTIAQTLGVTEAGSQPLRDTLRAFLREKRLLLILDNFEQVLDAAPVVSDLLAGCAAVRVMVTSRAALRLQGERQYAIPPLSLPTMPPPPLLEALPQYEAVRLFIARAQDVKPDFRVTNETAPAVAEICVRLDGLPLVIELAAARVRLFPPQALLARLSHRLGVLTGGARDVPERHRTLRATIDWSYSLLSVEEQALFARLSVFVGGRTLDAVEAVCNADGALDVLAGVDSLLEKSLLGQVEDGGETRFVLLETLHEYARERLEASGQQEELRQRHAAYFLALAEEAERALKGADQGAWLARLEWEYDNLRAALGWAWDTGEAEAAARLAAALGHFWEIRGSITEGRRWLERALAMDGGLPRQRAQIYTWAGTMAWYQADYERAMAHHMFALDLYRALKDMPGIAFALNNIGAQAVQQGDYGGAAAHFEQSVALARDVGDRRLVGYGLNNLADMAHMQGDSERAIALYRESLGLFQDERDLWGVAIQLQRLGMAERSRGHGTQAQTWYRQSLTVAQELGDTGVIVECVEGLAGVACGAERPQRGARLLGAAAALRVARGTPVRPAERAMYERDVEAARAALGAEVFETMWAAGQSMTADAVIAEVLAGDDVATG